MALGNVDKGLSISSMPILAFLTEQYHLLVSYMTDLCLYGCYVFYLVYILAPSKCLVKGNDILYNLSFIVLTVIVLSAVIELYIPSY